MNATATRLYLAIVVSALFLLTATSVTMAQEPTLLPTPAAEITPLPSATAEPPTPSATAEPPTPSATATAAPSPTSTPVAALGAAMGQGQGMSQTFAGILTFALVTITLLLAYLNAVQQRFYAVAERLGLGGRTVSSELVPSIGEAKMATVNAEATDSTATLQLDGPGIVAVGAESDLFIAKTSEGKLAKEATWSVQPSDMGLILPSSGAVVKLVAAAPGVYTVTATDKMSSATGKCIAVPATAFGEHAESADANLPFIGSGYGTLILGIILIAALLALGIADVLDKAAIPALLGSLIGYAFAVGAEAKSGAKASTTGGKQRGGSIEN